LFANYHEKPFVYIAILALILPLSALTLLATMSDQESEQTQEMSPHDVEKLEEAKLKAKYAGGPGRSRRWSIDGWPFSIPAEASRQRSEVLRFGGLSNGETETGRCEQSAFEDTLPRTWIRYR
jgi:hypothetical protein